jgi:hypothetical protein
MLGTELTIPANIVEVFSSIKPLTEFFGPEVHVIQS